MNGSVNTTTTGGHGGEPRLCLPPLPPRRPQFVPPAGSCDCHVHVFGDPARFPYEGDRSFTPELGLDLAALGRLHRTLGIAKAVIVQTGIQSPDVVLEALRAEPDRLRGVAVLRGDTSDRRLDELNEAGVRGIRINLFRRAGAAVYRGGAGPDDLAALAPRIKRLGWHIQAWLDADDLPQWAPTLLSYGLQVVVDHMGRITTDRGVDSPGFVHLCEMVRRGEVWCKLSCADRISVAGTPYSDAVPYARALLEANRDRVVWGTDWPHVNYYDAVPDDAALLDLVPTIATDAADVDRLFVANPRQLYGF
ncbi:2-pyrone-4,6-dicarbaxylate hydrolase [Methylobacterium brachiatum]|uniref:amidohydrolase family protein n=1 Tax=Methylobacterium sp. E-066 TaxID=2836584 RepID=UPI00138195F9|nr:amidohydrolase family protein [Methylobacterium sp. E-066]MCJ2144785.1 amidohydrolase family protein [Methylobacterium sp. E-066]CAA2158557.1 2-pyrone-4,6-dicarbaxylate hydrolase [Methylobacterium brachiatum]